MWRPVAGAEGAGRGTGRRRGRCRLAVEQRGRALQLPAGLDQAEIDRLELLTGVGLFEIVLQVGEAARPSRKAATASFGASGSSTLSASSSTRFEASATSSRTFCSPSACETGESGCDAFFLREDHQGRSRSRPVRRSEQQDERQDAAARASRRAGRTVTATVPAGAARIPRRRGGPPRDTGGEGVRQLAASMAATSASLILEASPGTLEAMPTSSGSKTMAAAIAAEARPNLVGEGPGARGTHRPGTPARRP